MVNGSPHEEGCTYTALEEVAKALEKAGVETEIMWLGVDAIAGCIGCGACAKTGKGCFRGDVVNEFIEKAKEADGFIFGTPVHYAAASGALTSFMDRAFYAGGKYMTGKPAAGVVSCRRGGAASTFDQQIFYHQLYAHRFLSVLEPGSWKQRGRSGKRRRRHADHAYAGKQHGMASEVH